MIKQLALTLCICLASVLPQTSQAQTFCERTTSDPDGDGWGWENGGSCKVKEKECDIEVTCITDTGACDYSNSEEFGGWGWNPYTATSCAPISFDEDDDIVVTPEPINVDNCDYSDAVNHSGWGWDNVSKQSCPPKEDETSDEGDKTEKETVQPASECDYSNSSSNGGWGWNNSTKTSCAPVIEESSGFNSEGGTKIDELILISGQSNALTQDSTYSETLDSYPDNLIVHTTTDGWQKPNLCTQVWNGTWYPAAGGKCGNHIGFQIAKQFALNNPNKMVGFVPTGVAGMPIVCWNVGAACMAELEDRVSLALQENDSNSTFDMIAFIQGESDGGSSLWLERFYLLADRLRASYGNPVIMVPETFKSDINSQISSLCSDGKSYTQCVSSDGLNASDGTHWDADDVRILGKRFYEAY